MYLIDDPTSTSSMPAMSVYGTGGWFTEGDPTIPTAATKVRGDWLNMLQAELKAILTAASMTPDQTKASLNQVQTAIAAQIATAIAQAAVGQCYLTASSATQLILLPFEGNRLTINGVPQQVPSGGVTVSNSGLAANTLYYVYASMSGGTMVLACSTTGHVQGSNGVQVKNGDATQSLVGMIYTSAATPGQFVFSTANRQVLNWYNRRNISAVSIGASGSTFTNTSVADIYSAIDITFLSWGDDAVSYGSSGGIQGSTAGAYINLGVGLDGVTSTNQIATFPSVNGFVSYSSQLSIFVTEGLHTVSLRGYLNSGSAAVSPGTNYAMARG